MSDTTTGLRNTHTLEKQLKMALGASKLMEPRKAGELIAALKKKETPSYLQKPDEHSALSPLHTLTSPLAAIQTNEI